MTIIIFQRSKTTCPETIDDPAILVCLKPSVRKQVQKILMFVFFCRGQTAALKGQLS